jgi:hypothetical protein
MVFDTTTESFRQMRSPIGSGNADLFEIDGMLAVYRCNDAATEIDIWVLEDCKGEAWAFKNRVELPVAQLTVQFGEFHGRSDVVVLSWDGDVLVLAGFGDWLIQVHINGKMVASFHNKGLYPTQLQLKQTLVLFF